MWCCEIAFALWWINGDMKTGVCEWVRTQHCYWSFVIERRTIFHLCKTFQIVCNCNQGVTGSFRQQLLMMTSSAKRRTRAWSREETIIMARGASLFLSISRYDKKYRNNHRTEKGQEINIYVPYVDYWVCACVNMQPFKVISVSEARSGSHSWRWSLQI